MYIFDIAEALAILHTEGFVHCDLRIQKLFSYECDGVRAVKVGGLEWMLKEGETV
jgi:hypothetical protein